MQARRVHPRGKSSGGFDDEADAERREALGLRQEGQRRQDLEPLQRLEERRESTTTITTITTATSHYVRHGGRSLLRSGWPRHGRRSLLWSGWP